ncbi:MAG: zinc dependent phospholipase C family protein [Lachnospiraceae bacterium]|nr:zinc dependent phospholipase C family protein [Lachnospiraceae bacterium]
MKKRTHFALSRQILRDNCHDLTPMEAALYCFGSIFPDCSPLCLIRPHKFNITHYKTKKRMVKLLSGKKNNLADCFRLGCLSHHVADYFTAPHNREGVAGFCMDHRGYENNLHLFFKEQMEKEGATVEELDMLGIEFWKQMCLKHQEYMDIIREEESFDTDYAFIREQNLMLFMIYMRVRMQCANRRVVYA